MNREVICGEIAKEVHKKMAMFIIIPALITAMHASNNQMTDNKYFDKF